MSPQAVGAIITGSTPQMSPQAVGAIITGVYPSNESPGSWGYNNMGHPSMIPQAVITGVYPSNESLDSWEFAIE